MEIHRIFPLHPNRPQEIEKQTEIASITNTTRKSKNNVWIMDMDMKDTDDYNDLDNIPFYMCLKPLFRTMALFGLYRQPSSEKKISVASFMKYLYGALVIVLLWTNFIRAVATLWLEKGLAMHWLVTRIISCVWFLQCASNASFFFYLSFTTKFQKFFQYFQKHCQTYSSCTLGLGLDARWLKKRVVFSAVFCILFVFCNSGSSYLFIYGPLSSANYTDTVSMFLAPFDINSNVGIQILIHVAFVFTCTSWTLPVALFCIICLQLSRQFTKLNTIVSNGMKTDGTITACLERIRREHQGICRSVGHADAIFSFIMLIELGLNLPLICFLLYELVLVSYPFGVFMTILICFWFVMISLNVGLISWFGAALHENAHSAVHNLHDISVASLTDNHRILELSMFMAKMNGTPIAITIWNLIPLTKEFMLTAIGVLVTYFALVAQTI